MQEVSRDVADPVSHKPLMEALMTRDSAKDASAPEFRINPLGSGSDYTPFLQHLGVATLDIRFASEDSGVYHSDYDDYNWYSHFSDTAFVYGRTLSQVHSTALMRLADAPVLPFNFTRFGTAISRYLNEIEKLPDPRKPDFRALTAEIATVRRTAAAFDATYARALPRLFSASAGSLDALNRTLIATERDLASDPGLPGRPWYRHRIYAPGTYTGYDAKTLPGIREAVEAGNIDVAREQTDQVVQALQRLNDSIVQAEKQMGGL
jgi:N-acetylated-alpha-linked acidic dipeptidase